AFRGSYKIFICRDCKTRRDAALRIDVFAFACFERDLFNQVFGKVVYPYRFLLLFAKARLLFSNSTPYFQRPGIVSDNLTVNAVLQRSDYTSTVRVIFGVRGKYKLNIQRHAQLESANLDVTFLQDIE